MHPSVLPLTPHTSHLAPHTSHPSPVPKFLRKGGPVTGNLHVKLVETGDTVSVAVSLPSNAEKAFNVSFAGVNNISAWYPNGYGEQPLYNVVVTFTPSGTPAPVR